jgi:hypothetical protein
MYLSSVSFFFHYEIEQFKVAGLNCTVLGSDAPPSLTLSSFQYTLVGVGSPMLDVLSSEDCDDL